MFCKNCGAELADGATFCPNCGANLESPAKGGGSFDGFMKKLFDPKLAKLLTIIFLIVAAGSNILVTVGNFGSAFMPVIGDLVILVFETALYAAVAVLLLIGKVELAKKTLLPIFSYWLISAILGNLSSSGGIVGGQNGLIIVFCLFEFIAALGLIAAGIMFVLSTNGKEKLGNIAWIIVLTVLGLLALAMLFRIIYFITVSVNWTRYFGAITSCAFAFGMIFAISAVKGEEEKKQPEQAQTSEQE